MASSCIFADGFEVAGSTTPVLFRSLGTDATGTLNAWTTDFGSSAIASSIVTLGPTNSAIHAGHSDWTDCTFTVRFQLSASSTAEIYLHGDIAGTTGGSHHWVRASVTPTHLGIDKQSAGVVTSGVAGASPTVTAGTWFWMVFQVVGTTYTATIYTDSAGAIGTPIANGSVSATVTNSDCQAGFIGLQGTNGGGVQFGGAFANVCTVTGPVPTGWAPVNFPGWTTLEPSFCWSSNAPYAGTKSLSIYAPYAIAGGWEPNWGLSGASFGAGAYTLSAQARVIGISSNSAIIAAGSGPALPVRAAIVDSAWHAVSASGTIGTGGLFCGINNSATAGFAYFDNVALYSGTLPVQPTFAKSGGKYIATFGGQALPNGQGTLAAIDLNDRVNSFAFTQGDFLSDDDNVQRGFAQVPYLAKGQWTYDDFGQRTIAIPCYYIEDATHTLGQFLAALSQAGEQQLTFDNLTYIPCKYAGVTSRKFVIASSPMWTFTLNFVGRIPWFQDIAASTLAAQALTTDAGTSVGILNPGSVFCEPVLTLTVPSTNAVAINSIQIKNTTSGEFLTVNFLSRAALAASTAYVITIDCAAMTATDQSGNTYDVSGSFPMLYGPAGMVNQITTIVTPASGSSSGLTLAASYQSRWQI